MISSYYIFLPFYGVYSHFPFNSGPTGPTGPAYRPDTLVTINETPQALGANVPVVFANNVERNGTGISHEENSSALVLNEEGLYTVYYNGLVTGSAGAAYPLTATVALYVNGRRVASSADTVTIPAAGRQVSVAGTLPVRVSAGTSAVPSTITVQNETANVTWNYAEIIAGKSF